MLCYPDGSHTLNSRGYRNAVLVQWLHYLALALAAIDVRQAA